MFASGVLATGLGLLFGSLVNLSLLGQIAEGKTRATGYLSSVLEQARQTPRNRLFTISPLAPPKEPGYAMTVAIDAFDAAGVPVRLPVADPATAGAFPRPVQVRVTVVCTTPRGHMLSLPSTTCNGTP